MELPLNPCDFGFEYRDTCPQFLDRKGIEILPGELGQGIIRALGQEIVRVHFVKVDPKRPAVNKRRFKL